MAKICGLRNQVFYLSVICLFLDLNALLGRLGGGGLDNFF